MPNACNIVAMNKTKVWDFPTRFFHWALALSVTTSYVSMELDEIEIHIYSGSAVLCLILFRIIWGFVGGYTSRWSNFISGPVSVWRYIRSSKAEKRQTFGHSALAGWAVLVMMLCLIVQVTTGLFADDEIYTTGPLAKHVSSSFSSTATSIHYKSSDVLLFVIGLHTLANVFYLIFVKVNLIKPMLSGYVKGREVMSGDNNPSKLVVESIVKAIAILCIAMAVTYAIFYW